MNIQELIEAKRKELAAKSNRDEVEKLPPGSSAWRILPSWRAGGDPTFFHEYGAHWLKASPKEKPRAVYVCEEKTFGRACPVCEAIGNAIRSADSDEQINHLKTLNATQRYLVNAIRTDRGGNGEVKLLELPNGVFTSLLDLFTHYGDITDVTTGIPVIIQRTGSGIETRYTLLPARDAMPLTAEQLSQAKDIDAFVEGQVLRSNTKALGVMKEMTKEFGYAGSAPMLTAPSETASTLSAGKPVEWSSMAATGVASDALEASFDEASVEDELEAAMAAPAPKAKAVEPAAPTKPVEAKVEELDELDGLSAEELEAFLTNS